MVMKMFKQMMIIFSKEIKSIIRDKKSFILGLLMPLVLVPSLLFVIGYSMGTMKNSVSKNVNIAINHTENSFYDLCVNQKSISIIEVSNPTKALNAGQISAYVEVDENIDQKLLNGENFDLNIKYKNGSIDSTMSMAIVECCKSVYMGIAKQRDLFTSVNQLRETVKIYSEQNDLSKSVQEQMPEIDNNLMYFNMLMPMMMILYCFLGAMNTSNELGVGEKERGTFEPLLSTGACRASLIGGKLMAVTFMSFINGLSTIIGLFAYLLISSGGQYLDINIGNMVCLILIMFLISLLFSAICLVFSFYSKSYKEAQIYSLPFSVLSTIISGFTWGVNASNVKIFQLFIPFYNFACLIIETLSNSINPLHLLIVSIGVVVLVYLLVLLMRNMLKKESILFRI